MPPSKAGCMEMSLMIAYTINFSFSTMSKSQAIPVYPEIRHSHDVL